MPYAVPLPTLLETPVLNLDLPNSHLVVAFDRESTAANLFSREVDGRRLRFSPADDAKMKDVQTGTVWNRKSGGEIRGPLEGKCLERRNGFLSYARAWNVFHPNSTTVRPNEP